MATTSSGSSSLSAAHESTAAVAVTCAEADGGVRAGRSQVRKQQHLYEPSGWHGLVLEHQHGRGRQPSMTQACLPAWAPALQEMKLPACNGTVAVRDPEAVRKDVANLQQGRRET